MIKEYIEDLTAGGVNLGDTLELALELGEKHEAFVTKCKMVSFCETVAGKGENSVLPAIQSFVVLFNLHSIGGGA